MIKTTDYFDEDLQDGTCRCCSEDTRIVPGDGRCPDCIEEEKFIKLTINEQEDDEEESWRNLPKRQ